MEHFESGDKYKCYFFSAILGSITVSMDSTGYAAQMAL